MILLDEERDCRCQYESIYDFVGPYCKDWVGSGQEPFCFLAGRKDGRFCPDAFPLQNVDFYATSDKRTCSRSEGEVLCDNKNI